MIPTAFMSFSARTRSGCRRSDGVWVKRVARASWASTLLLASVFAIGIAYAQITAAISGRIEDATGAVVNGATVTVKSLETGATRTVTTGESGNFRVLS